MAEQRLLDTEKHDSPSRVAILASAFHPHTGGVEELVRQLGHALQARGRRPTIFTMRWPTTLAATEVVEGLPVFRYIFRSPDGGVRSAAVAVLSGPLTFARFVRRLRRDRCEVLHVQCVSSSAWFALQASRVLRIPLVVTLQGELTMDATGLYERSRFARYTLRQMLQHADVITACSRATLREAEQWVGFSFGSRGRVIHNGVRVADFATSLPHEESSPYVLAAGRSVREKGFDVLLDAMAILVKEPTFRHRLLIAGDGPERGSLERAAGGLGLDERVRFLGAVDRTAMVSLFRGADLFVLPSRHEPFGIVNLEAMAAGVPVVATAVGGVPEFVVDEETGVLVRPGDAAELASAIDRLLRDEELRDRCARNGTEVAARHDWSSLADQYIEVYTSVTEAESHISPASIEPTTIRSRQRALYEHRWNVGRTVGLPDRIRQQHFGPYLRGLVLDVGCGDGSLQRSFPETQIVGLDQAISGLRAGSNRGVCAIAEALPFRDASFDSLVISEVLEHVGDPVRALQECRRVLRGDGQLLITVPTLALAAPETLFRRMKFGVWPARAPVPKWDPEHERRFTPSEIDSVVRTAGFAIALDTVVRCRLDYRDLSVTPATPGKSLRDGELRSALAPTRPSLRRIRVLVGVGRSVNR